MGRHSHASRISVARLLWAAEARDMTETTADSREPRRFLGVVGGSEGFAAVCFGDGAHAAACSRASSLRGSES